MKDRLIASNEPAAGTPGGNLRLTLVLTALVAVIGLAGFAGWIANGDNLFWSLLQAGLAWCM